ncbi:hypothetical protein K1719_002197 [Acacia pycnantha]|nr:hypothetical protein K1719_002197 [Acacia pycnantha]
MYLTLAISNYPIYHCACNFKKWGGTIGDNCLRVLSDEEKLSKVSYWVTDGAWNFERFISLVSREVFQRLLATPPPLNHAGEDVLLWSAATNGLFSVKSAYYMIEKPPTNLAHSCFNLIWRWQEFPAWQASSENWIKINVDGAVSSSGNVAGAGGVLRDSHGDWIVGFSSQLESLQEAQSITESLVMLQIRDYVARNREVRFCYVPRSHNCVADTLAKEALSVSYFYDVVVDQTWPSEIPLEDVNMKLILAFPINVATINLHPIFSNFFAI